MKKEKASIIIQRNIRKSIARKRYILQKWVIVKLQSLYRSKKYENITSILELW